MLYLSPTDKPAGTESMLRSAVAMAERLAKRRAMVDDKKCILIRSLMSKFEGPRCLECWQLAAGDMIQLRVSI